MKEKFIKLLRAVHQSGDAQLFGRFKAFCLQNFKGGDVQTELRELRLEAAGLNEPTDREEIKFSPEDFRNHPKPKVVTTPTTQIVSGGDTENVGNPLKAILQKSNDEIKDKFLDEQGKPDIDLALGWINDFRQKAGAPPIEAKSFSKKFFEQFRATLTMELQTK